MNDMTPVQTAQSQPVAVDKDWWRGCVIYQIYPRSFQDSNGDGIGDLKGITDRLPYIASLGVDAIWISPFFPSPMEDFGYDVSNYTDVDAMFGTLEDFDALIARAHSLGLKVMIDQVISHSSNRHPWFQQSRSSRDNAKHDWYVWADANPDGTPPNNWLSIFGGSAWQWDTTRLQYYMHNFLASQPDLNFHNRDVQDALLDAVRFWLERGVDGFRLDTINFYVHSQGLEDNPPLEEASRNDTIAPKVNPYNFQNHLYDKNQPENLEFLKRFRALLDEFPAATAVGEVGDDQRGLELVAQYTAGNDKVHMCYSFDFLSREPLKPKRVQKVLTDFENMAPDGWVCWAFSNHDVERHGSRWTGDVSNRTAYLKMVATLLMTLRGSICLYQGEELGLGEANIAFEDLQDPYGIQFWPEFKGRDGCRTPMVWNHNEPNAGFSAGKPWLPIAEEHLHKTADMLAGESDSLHNHYRDMLAFRARHSALIKGEIEFLLADDDVLIFKRQHDNDTVVVAFNMSEQSQQRTIDLSGYAAIGGSLNGGTLDGKALTMPPLAVWIGDRDSDNLGGTS